MSLTGTRLVRLGTVHAVGLAALAFAVPAHATDDPPPPVPSVAVSPVLTSEEQDDRELEPAAAGDAEISLQDQESPGKVPSSAPATAQLKSVRQGWSQVISPTHAQKSPERASTGEPRRAAVAAPPNERQYHRRQVQYQHPSTARSKPRALVLPVPSFSLGEPARITRSSAPIGSPNQSRNVSYKCAPDPEGYWSQDLPAADAEGVECATDPPADAVTSDDPSDSTVCGDAAEQYQPDETQYQTPPAPTCDPSNESVVPISEAEVPVPSASESSDPAAPQGVASPTTPTTPVAEPVAAPVVPDTQPVPPAAAGLPTPAGPASVTAAVAASRPAVQRPSRHEPASLETAVHAARVIPARARPLLPSQPVRPRPARTPSTKPKNPATRSRLEAAAPRSLRPASTSPEGNLFGYWLLLVLLLSSVAALALLFPQGALVARSLRARVGSKGLSGDRTGTNSSGGIRYRD